jgi:mannose-6-phosphate isomerase-like protein (cupin superfamily)
MKNALTFGRYVFNSKDVADFSPAGYKDAFVSRLLIDRDNVGSEKLVMNYFALMPGKKTDPGSHPAPFDEVYYVLRGHGTLYLGEAREEYEIEPDSVAFIPHDTLHFVINGSQDELEMITIMPGPIEEGANFVYDQRKREWGKSFVLKRQTPQKGDA